MVFYVKNGKGLLSTKYGYLENEALATLVYGDTPLIKFQADEAYFCPTREKLVAAGYGLEMSDQKVISELREVLNHKFISLEKSLENLQLLLRLLPAGYYALVDTELCPTIIISRLSFIELMMAIGRLLIIWTDICAHCSMGIIRL
ncbi:hypothetical protein [Desulfosporosinus youngiae]|uniref:hypothetical protein n=1 Tax=Desulfosporosinus youngiae TaxID=339862 RepID=UPI0002FD5A8F|nr:hypothetical protein [Desulfosporosinus youngiae]